MILHHQTPVFESIPLSTCLGKPVFLKMECYQPTGSFKIRGIGRLCEESVQSGKTHLISSSGGNAGIAVAYSGRLLGAKVTVIVPGTTSLEVCQRIALEGADVQIHGSVWDESHAHALRLAENNNGAYIHPFDHPVIWNGHATLIDELTDQCPELPDMIIVSVGGGGLFCGIMEGLKHRNWNGTTIITVETEGAASLASSVKAGKLVELENITSIATTLGSKQVTAKALEYALSPAVHSITVSDNAAIDACVKFSDDHKVLIEPASGASLSIVYQNHDSISSAKNVLVIVCGGIGANLQKMNEWKQEYFPK